MNALTLVITLCTPGDVSACMRVSIPGFTLPGACALAAVQAGAEILADHPGYRVAQAKCGRARR